jgi:hypothetical protein
MKSWQRYLILGVTPTVALVGVIGAAAPASADCTYSGGTTLCSQGDVRGADGVPRASSPVVPYECDYYDYYDYYCDDNDWGVNIDVNPGPRPPVDIGRPGRPGGGNGGGGGGGGIGRR